MRERRCNIPQMLAGRLQRIQGALPLGNKVKLLKLKLTWEYYGWEKEKQRER